MGRSLLTDCERECMDNLVVVQRLDSTHIWSALLSGPLIATRPIIPNNATEWPMVLSVLFYLGGPDQTD